MGRSMTGGEMKYHGVLLFPAGSDDFGEDVALEHYNGFRADMLLTVKDVWCFRHIQSLAINFTPMVPIDSTPLSPSITSRLSTPFKVISISRFGQKELKNAGIESEYIPHGIDVNTYKPLNRRAECRKLFYLNEDDYIVGYVGLNRARKMIPRVLRVYKRFLENNPDVKSHMFLWTDVRATAPPTSEDDVGMGVSDVSINLLPEIMSLGLGERVIWPEEKLVRKGIPEWAGDDYQGGWDMVKIYNAIDVILGASNEGFWFPGLDAQACGVQAVQMDVAAAPEIVGAGYVVPYVDYIITNSPGTRYMLVDIDKAAEALEKVMNSDREKMARKARAFAERFSWEKVADTYWKPFLEDCEKELHPLITKEGLSHW